MAEGEEWKTVFRIYYGLYKWCVMPFRLTNAPVIMQRYINSVLLPFFDKNYSVYLNDILIWSYADHNDYIGTVMNGCRGLERSRDEGGALPIFIL